ncbi:transglutaminase family protein [Gryllotalpicola ginsengisoli]|uniref:transglutaminase family protein n=1 Tax=Gryllotalpicola ginsengisoli TaxID=444608 RepID=UPI0003B45B94|nr:transglutaminase family protein [Gryllotalpicola ginsengisoli]
MKRMRVRHVTGFRYEVEASASYNEARMLPASVEGQVVLSAHLDITPSASQYAYNDYWGTRVTAFEVLSPHREMTLAASSLVEVSDRPAGDCEGTWDEMTARAQTAVQYVEQLRQSSLTAPAEEVRQLAADLAAGADTPCAAAEAICRAIGEAMEYVPGATTVNTTAADAWAARRGVCQDIVHVSLGALRSVGIPARYVSGYLHPDPDAPVGQTVLGESHAWLEWFCGAWRGWDPTNLIPIGDRHVYIGRGRDYDDIAPIRGVYAGAGAAETFVRVEITRES